MVRKSSPWYRFWRWLWIFALIGGPVYKTRTWMEQVRTPIELSVVHRPIVFGIIGLLLIPVILKRTGVLLRDHFKLMMLFCVWQLLFAVWSVYPLWSLYKSAEYGVMISMAALTASYIRSAAELRNWANLVWFYFGILTCSVWIGLLIFGQQALLFARTYIGPIPFLLQGVYPRMNPNSVSYVASILGIVAVSRLLTGRSRHWVPLLVLSLLTMVLAQGRSGMLAFVAGISVLLLLHRRIKICLLLTTGLILIMVVSTWRTIIWDFIRRGQSIEVLVFTLSYRVPKWKAAWETVSSEGISRVLIGMGAYTGARFVVMPKLGMVVASATHSTWADAIADVGLIGMGLLGMAVLVVGYGFLQVLPKVIDPMLRSLVIEVLAVFSAVVTRSFFTGNLTAHNEFPWFLALGFLLWLKTRNPEKDLGNGIHHGIR